MSRTARLVLLACLCGLVTPLHARTATAACGGDCDAGGSVTVDEILLAVQVALGAEPDGCTAADANGDLAVTVDEIVVAVGNALAGCPVSTASAPPLSGSEPASGARDVARNSGIELVFAADVDAQALPDFRLVCGNGPIAVGVTRVGPQRLRVEPAGLLPDDQDCLLDWLGAQGPAAVGFRTTAVAGEATAIYDRVLGRSTHPFPDDFFVVDDPTKPNGVRLAVPAPTAPTDVVRIFQVLTNDTRQLDGFSPIAPIIIELSEAPDPATFPTTPAASLAPTANAALLDLTAGSATFGERIPFRADIRDDVSVIGVRSHSILAFPSIPLTPGGRYGFVVSNRVTTRGGRPLAPSPFFAAAMAEPVAGEPEAVTRVRALAREVVDVAAQTEGVLAADVALAVRFTVRTTDDITRDLLTIKQRTLAEAAPGFTIDSIEPGTSPDVAAIVRGTWQAPEWRRGLFFVRDDAGLPVRQGTNDVPFVLALPAAANDGHAPITMYQHGNPGSAEREVPGEARDYLGEAGFAVIGFTDNLNREVSQGETDTVAAITRQVTEIFFALISNRKLPDFWVQLNAEQIAFVRLLSSLGSIDVLPLGAPDGVPDLDVEAPLTYVGISQGGNYAPGLLPYAPEFKAAAVMVGGARLAEVLIHQQADAFLVQLGQVFRNMTPADIWVGLSLFQTIYDGQDQHNHARFLYREPFEVAGTLRKPSVLLVEGLDDTLVPNHATESLAWALGPIPHLLPVQRAVPFLETIEGPVRANIDAETTAAFFQYVPVGIEGIDPTPGCAVLSDRSAREGHYCAQGAAESERQRAEFFLSAMQDGAPTIINPIQ
jgi:hypothetical protein